jgi:hypothetical protein
MGIKEKNLSRQGGQMKPRTFCFLMIVFLFILGFAWPNGRQKPRTYKAITFKEDLRLSQADWFPYRLNVDAEGNIYVLSGKERTFIVFDPSGRERSRRQIAKGQGPGEFSDFDFVFDKSGRLLAADWAQRRLTVFDKDFRIDKIEKLNLYGDQFLMDSKGQRYFLAYQILAKARERNRVVLTRCDANGKILKEIASYEWGPRRRGDGTFEEDLYRIQLKYALDPQDNVCYAFSNKYEVFVVSPEGEAVQTIKKEAKTRKVTKEDIDRLLPPSSSKSPYKHIIPDNVPPIAGIFPLKNDYLLVVTFEKAGQDTALAGDLFDGGGRLVATVSVPKYYNWDFLLAPQKSRALVRGDYFYAIEADADEENFWVKRYKIVWE